MSLSSGIYGLPHPHVAAAAQAPPRTLWLITIVDLVTLLLAFFVLMFSMSHVETKKYAALAKSYGVYSEGPISNPVDLGPAITRALAEVKKGRPALIDVVSQPR